jgi:hypothetical protein
MIRAHRFGVAAILAAGALSSADWTTPAFADEPSSDALAKAREEFRRGIALEAAGDYENALAVFKGVALVKSTPQVRFHIATCEEKVGDWVGALGSFRMALFEAQQSKVADVESESQSALTRLEPRIPKLTIVRGTGAAVATIRLDGRELGAASIGTPISVNPGPHSIEATAPGRKKRLTEITLEPERSAQVSLVLDALPPDELKGGAHSEAGGPTAMLPVGITIAGLGAASFVASGVFFGMKQSAQSDLDAACGPDGQSCPESLRDTADSGRTWDLVSTATFIAGASAVAIGGTLIVIDLATMSSSDEEAAPAGAPTATVGFGPGSVVVTGRF